MLQTVNRSILGSVYKKRPDWSHKGKFGKLLVIGGSRRYSGSPALAALSGIRSGVDLVTVASPRRAADIVATFSPDMITHPLDGDCVGSKHLKELLSLSEEHDAIVIGGGLERRPDTLKTARSIISKSGKPCVIDADAIHSIKGMKRIGHEHVITPHPKEFFLLSKTSPTYDHEQRVVQVSDLSVKMGCTVLLKGSFDVISDGKDNFINTTGNPYMTKGGTGDTLAGICGAILARGSPSLEAACAAAFINGAAGDLAARKYGEGLFASDLINEINHIVK